MIVSQHTAETPSAFNLANHWLRIIKVRLHRIDDAMLDSQMVAFVMIVKQVLRYRVAQLPITKEDQPVQTLMLDGLHESLNMSPA